MKDMMIQLGLMHESNNITLTTNAKPEWQQASISELQGKKKHAFELLWRMCFILYAFIYSTNFQIYAATRIL